MSSTITTITEVEQRVIMNAVDTADNVHRDMLGRAEVLARLFELLSAGREENAIITDFGGRREVAFWHGLSRIVNEIAEGLDSLHDSVDQIHQALQDDGGAR